MLALKNKKVLIVAPHPDDESAAVGGLSLKVKAEGGKLFVLVFTAGTEKQYGSKSNYALRVKELSRAMKMLKVDGYELIYKNRNHLVLDTIAQKELIDIVEKKSKFSINKIAPDILVAPGPSYNQDHHALFKACLAVTRPYPCSLKPTPDVILLYSNFDEQFWNPNIFFDNKANFWVDISRFTEEKMKLLSCYKSQLKMHKDHWRTIQNILLSNRLCGKKIGVESAEEFFCLKFAI